MESMAFDSLRYARRLKTAGVPEPQAEAHAEAMAEAFGFFAHNIVTREYLDATLDARLGDLQAKLERKIDEQGITLERKIDEQGATLGQRIIEQGVATEKRFADLEIRLEHRFGRIERTLAVNTALLGLVGVALVVPFIQAALA